VSDTYADLSLRSARPQRSSAILPAILAALLVCAALLGYAGEFESRRSEQAPGIWAVLPFVGLLLSIALLPLMPATKGWWESNANRLTVALSFSLATLAYYWASDGGGKAVSILQHAVWAEYVPFIALLFSLYVISGGISLKGDLAARPATNTAFLAVGALIASFIGTTGASMLLIRPLLQTNSERKRVKHTVIFFIFLVSNIGGCLLPIGDPPLFLGYLRGVPFLWTTGLWIPWLVTCAGLLVIYFVWDSLAYRKERPVDIARDERERTKLVLAGKRNVVWLLGVVLCVALVSPDRDLPWLGVKPFPLMRELLMIGFAALSLGTTDTQVRQDNRFNYHAILEVAALFIGIFICMQAPIEILRANGHSLASLLSSPMRFFWATGTLSSLLDNAPTYIVFFETAVTMTPSNASAVVGLGERGAILASLLTAISLGAVFMGAMTYIGNGPNFMVKSIAEQSGIRMPSFFGYLRYSVGILGPLFVAVTLLFLA
jgi:Na+/H+ antiporter NhaD/arsenite permease-like protein